MEMITKPQLQKLHVLLTQLGLIEQKAKIVSITTYGRTESSKELTIQEGRYLIGQLADNDRDIKMRKKLFALAYEAGIIYGNSAEDKKMNTAKLNKFLKERGTVRKELKDLTHEEMIKTVSQFQQIVKHTHQTTANKATKALLDQLNIPVEKQPLNLN